MFRCNALCSYPIHKQSFKELDLWVIILHTKFISTQVPPVQSLHTVYFHGTTISLLLFQVRASPFRYLNIGSVLAYQKRKNLERIRDCPETREIFLKTYTFFFILTQLPPNQGGSTSKVSLSALKLIIKSFASANSAKVAIC